jgi:hypothetical protein
MNFHKLFPKTPSLIYYELNINGTGLEIGLLINFGESVEVKRKYRVYKPKLIKD